MADKISFYGLSLYHAGQVRIWPSPRTTGENTIDALRRLRTEIPQGRLLVIGDGAPYHRAKSVCSAAAGLGIELVP